MLSFTIKKQNLEHFYFSYGFWIAFSNNPSKNLSLRIKCQLTTWNSNWDHLSYFQWGKYLSRAWICAEPFYKIFSSTILYSEDNNHIVSFIRQTARLSYASGGCVCSRLNARWWDLFAALIYLWSWVYHLTCALLGQLSERRLHKLVHLLIRFVLHRVDF